MKYIYFDCYGGMDLSMLLSSIIDMDKDVLKANEIAGKISGGAELILSEVKRRDMYAASVCCDLKEPIPRDIADVIDECALSEETKSRLKLWYKLKSDGKAKEGLEELRELIYAALCLELIKSYECERVYISELSQGQGADIADGSIRPIPSPHTELLCKMAAIRVNSLPECPKEILTPGAAALMYVLNADYLPPKAHNVIKSGYGAGEYDSIHFANILRCILANEGEDELDLNFEELILNMKSEFSLSVK